MRLWQESTGQSTDLNSRDYETVGYVISGTAELESEGQIVALAEGDSWVMPRGAAAHGAVSGARSGGAPPTDRASRGGGGRRGPPPRRPTPTAGTSRLVESV